jgi:TorA maturation chaperone TorD
MQVNQKQNLIDLARSRSKIYRLLAEIFSHPPSKALIEKMMKDFLPLFYQSVGEDYSGLKVDLGSILKRTDCAKVFEEEFCALFQVPTKRYITPYESVYKEGKMAGRALSSVKKFYVTEGVAIDKLKDLPDYIGLEFDFMSYMIEREALALETTNKTPVIHMLEVEKKFLENHILTWFPRLSKNIKKQAQISFFPEIAEVTSKFLLQDLDEIKLLIKEVQTTEQ